MEISKILQLIKNGENSGVEFNRDDLRPEQLAREIVALANLKGGLVILGVEDDGTLSGVTRDNLETWIMDTVFGRYVHPQILPYYEEVEVQEGVRLAIITIAEGVSKPYVLRHNGREDIYVRVGSTCRLATREQSARLFASGGLLHTEILPVSGTILDDLDLARLKDYLQNLVADPEVPDSTQAWIDRLCGLGFMVKQGEGVFCTIAGLVLFGHSPRHSLRQAGIRWMSFADVDMNYAAEDDTLLDGPIVPLGMGKPGVRQIKQDGLLEKLMDRVRPFISGPDVMVDNLRREPRYFYPLDALREAILNAVAHRDWTRATEIEVVNFSDRIEITSPGSLPNSMTLEKVLAGQRSPRNSLIVDVLRDYGYVEVRGMGVRRKIVPLTLEFTGKDAILESTDDYFRVTLPAKIYV